MDIKQLNYLCYLHKFQSFTKAAKALNIAQPALSQSISRLEQELNVTLVERHLQHGQGIHLTAEGKVLHQHALLITNQFAQAKAQIQAMANLTQGEVRIAVPGMLGSYYLPSRLMAFKHQFPDLKLSLFEGGTRDALKMLEQEEVAIAIITEQDLKPEYESRLLTREEMVAAVSIDNQLTKLTSISLNEFLQHELVMFKQGYFHREWILNQASSLAITPNIAFETNLINLIKQLVAQDFAISCLLAMVLHKRDDIKALSFNPPMFLNLHIVWKKQRPISQADKAFVDFLLANK